MGTIKWEDGSFTPVKADEVYCTVFGRVKYMTLNKYWINTNNVADVRGPDGMWNHLDIKFDTRSAAVAWCEIVETTGAY